MAILGNLHSGSNPGRAIGYAFYGSKSDLPIGHGIFDLFGMAVNLTPPLVKDPGGPRLGFSRRV